MEESEEVRSSYLIIKDGKFWKVRNVNRWVGGSFTEYNKAAQWVENTLRDKEIKEFNKALKEIKKEPDLKKRSRKYKQLCQSKKYS